VAGSAAARRPLPAWILDARLHLLVIFLAAAFFRLWHIAAFPPGLFGDEAVDGLDALDVLAGRGAIFFPANYGREGLHMWIVAGAFRLLGVTPLALRLPSVLAGILTALATYWLGRELGRYHLRTADASHIAQSASPLVALAAALYLATSFWHVHFSRFGIRGVFTPLCGALAFAALWRALNADADRPSSTLWAIVSGLFLGLSLHFYTASRFYPIMLVAFLLVQALAGREPALLRRHFGLFVIVVAVAALVFLPLGLYFVQHPGSFMQRAAEVAATGSENPLGRVAQAAWANVLQFGAPGKGDEAQFYNLPGRPVFDLLTAALALVGLLVLLWRFRHAAPLFLLVWCAVMLTPSFLATDRFPTLPRVLGVIPAIYFLPAVGLAAVLARLSRLPLRRWISSARVLKGGLGLLAVVALALHAGLTYRDYFRVWGPSPATFEAFDGDMTAAWRWLNRNAPNAPDDHVFLSSDIYRHPTFMLLHEHATVATYFKQSDPDLSWFDARTALPLPREGASATYLLGDSAPAQGLAADYLAQAGRARDRIVGPSGKPALEVITLPADAPPLPLPGLLTEPIAFTDRLALTHAGIATGPDGAGELRLGWRTSGPAQADWAGYRLEIAGKGWQTEDSLDAFRPPEWLPDGAFITTHRLATPGAGAANGAVRMRLVRAADGAPLTAPNAPDGWRTIQTGG
jgi:4-amino-4-deoxy-L-arabinose transferase-like glycosyltransferase